MSYYLTSSKLRNLLGHYEMVTSNFLNNVRELRGQNGSDLILD